MWSWGPESASHYIHTPMVVPWSTLHLRPYTQAVHLRSGFEPRTFLDVCTCPLILTSLDVTVWGLLPLWVSSNSRTSPLQSRWSISCTVWTEHSPPYSLWQLTLPQSNYSVLWILMGLETILSQLCSCLLSFVLTCAVSLFVCFCHRQSQTWPLTPALDTAEYMGG